MSEYAGTSRGVPPLPPYAPPPSAAPRAANPPSAQPPPGPAPEVAHEAYSFACLRCGHGWEESYDIAHHRDSAGRPYVVYYAHGHRVPSPLTRPSCTRCGGSVVRIMRSGRVRSAHSGSLLEEVMPTAGPLFVPETPARGPVPPSPLSGAVSERGTPRPPEPRGATAALPGGERPGKSGRHRHVPDLLHVFQRGRR